MSWTYHGGGSPAGSDNPVVNGTLTVTGALTAGSVVGTTTNDSAPAGAVGEVQSVVVASGSAVSLSSGVYSNIASLSLTAGDWECKGTCSFLYGASTSYTILGWGFSSVSATAPDDEIRGVFRTPAAVPGGSQITWVCPSARFSLATTTTIYLVGFGSFTVSTLGAYGAIRARRVR